MPDTATDLPSGTPAPALDPAPADARTEAPRPRRHRVVQQGRIVLGSRMVVCEIRDLSAGGAKLRLAPDLALPDLFELAIAAHDLRIRVVRLRWRRGPFAGVTFEAGCP